MKRRNHYKIKKRLAYIERECYKIVSEIGEIKRDPLREGGLLTYLSLIKTAAESACELVEQDRQAMLSEKAVKNEQ